MVKIQFISACDSKKLENLISKQSVSKSLECKYDIVTENSESSQIVYDHMITNENLVMKRFASFKRKFNFQSEYPEYINAFNRLYKISKISKYRSFQYRMLLNIVLCNDRLFRMRVTPTNVCTFCHTNKETVTHLFWEYIGTQNLESGSRSYTDG